MTKEAIKEKLTGKNSKIDEEFKKMIEEKNINCCIQVKYGEDLVNNSDFIRDLNIENDQIKKGVYIKIGKKDNQKLIFSSDTNLTGSYNRINFKERGFQKYWKN